MGRGRLRTPARAPTRTRVNNLLPLLYDLPGASPQNALEHHSANQGLFAWSCLATRGFLPRSTPERVFGVDLRQHAVAERRRRRSPSCPRSSAPCSRASAAEMRRVSSGPKSRAKHEAGLHDVHSAPVRNLNVDFNDGTITAFNLRRLSINLPDTANDLLTMDQVLSNEQRALLGCGPFFGTRCDSGRGGIAHESV